MFDNLAIAMFVAYIGLFVLVVIRGAKHADLFEAAAEEWTKYEDIQEALEVSVFSDFDNLAVFLSWCAVVVALFPCIILSLAYLGGAFFMYLRKFSIRAFWSRLVMKGVEDAEQPKNTAASAATTNNKKATPLDDFDTSPLGDDEPI